MGGYITEERFWAKVDRNPSGCWFWNGPFRDSTPTSHYNKERMSARDVAWIYVYEEKPRRTLTAACGNPTCINPLHAKGSLLRSDYVPIRNMIKYGIAISRVAEEYGVDRESIYHFMKRMENASRG